MEIKTYRAASVHEALQLIRRDLGPGAIVLRTREVRTGGWFGLLGGKRCTEVMASIETPMMRRWQRSSGALDQGLDLSDPRAMRFFPNAAETNGEGEQHEEPWNDDDVRPS